MKNFMIGMHGGYDDKKFHRDFRENFYGIEACLFKDEKDIKKLVNNIERKGIKLVFFESLLEKYKAVRLCLDTGRLHLQSRMDSDFHEKEIIKRFAKYAEVVHLWNVKISGNLENNHFPALPSLKVEDGWAPIEDYLKIIKNENNKVRIMFEHRSDLISNEELDNLYLWVESILEG